MLAGLITVALLATASAVEKPTLKAVQSAIHAKTAKKVHAGLKVSPKGVAVTASSSGYAQVYVEDGATTCTGDATMYYYSAFGMCFDNYDGTSFMQGIEQLSDGTYNQTMMYYSDGECMSLTGSSQQLWPGTCATAVDNGGAIMYVMGTSSKFSTPAKSYGELSYNSETDCDDDKNVMEASVQLMGVCIDTGFPGFYMTVDNCNKVTYYTDSDCSTKFADTYADDNYSDDDDDDMYADACYETGAGAGMNPEQWSTFYCDSAASMVSASGIAMIAASALAAFAMF